jgi:hypothetical protein
MAERERQVQRDGISLQGEAERQRQPMRAKSRLEQEKQMEMDEFPGEDLEELLAQAEEDECARVLEQEMASLAHRQFEEEDFEEIQNLL